MKFKDLFLFLEQEDPEDDVHNFNDDPEVDDVNNPPLPAMDDGDEPPADVEGGAMGNDVDVAGDEADQPTKPKKLSATQQIKQKWLSERPGLTDFQMAEAIGFFRTRRDGLRPYHPYGYIDPQTNRHYINTPEITSLVDRFPTMEPILSDLGKMLDLKNYPWEVMEFYIDIVQANNTIVDEENLVPGTKLPLDEQLAEAKERWSNRANQIVNEGGVIVYRIESKNESILYGSIQRVLNKMRAERGISRGNAYWCTTVPLNDRGRSNLWTNYRPQQAFYYVWDQNRDEEDEYYCSTIQAVQAGRGGPYTTVTLYNSTNSSVQWSEIVANYPQLNGKENLFPWFGETAKERQDITLDKISMRPGDKYYFGRIRMSERQAYVDSGRHVNKVQAFLTMDPQIRKLYVDKTTKENNDLQTRFLCDDPNDPFGILNILYLETKPENLYKYLDVKVLKSNLQIPEGILAIKKLIIGNNWRRWISDETTHHTLVALQTDKVNKNTKFGIMDIANGDIIKDPDYRVSGTETFVRIFDENGVTRKAPIVLQKYSFALGNGQLDPNQYFYVFTTTSAMTNKNDPNYLKGRIFDGPEGDEFINQQLEAGTLVSLSRKRS